MAGRSGVRIPTITVCFIFFCSFNGATSRFGPRRLQYFAFRSFYPCWLPTSSRFCTSLRRPNWLWGPTSRQFSAYRDSFQGLKRQERDDDHLFPSTLRRSAAIHPHTHPTYLQGVERDNFATFYDLGICLDGLDNYKKKVRGLSPLRGFHIRRPLHLVGISHYFLPLTIMLHKNLGNLFYLE